MNIDKLIYFKKYRNMTFQEIAELSGVPISTVHKVFHGNTKQPRRETIEAIERVLIPDRDVAYEGSVPAMTVRDTVIRYDYEGLGHNLGPYTLSDYYALPEDKRVELIDGVFYDMGSPTASHQMLAGAVFTQISNYIDSKHGDCEAFIAPLDVQLDQDDRTMVEPDVMILCDLSKLRNRCIYGAPDFVLEVLSPSTTQRDLHIKLDKYQAAGVREYWVLNPDKMMILKYAFEHDSWPQMIGLRVTPKVPVEIYDGDLEVDFKAVIAKIDKIGDAV